MDEQEDDLYASSEDEAPPTVPVVVGLDGDDDTNLAIALSQSTAAAAAQDVDGGDGDDGKEEHKEPAEELKESQAASPDLAGADEADSIGKGPAVGGGRGGAVGTALEAVPEEEAAAEMKGDGNDADDEVGGVDGEDERKQRGDGDERKVVALPVVPRQRKACLRATGLEHGES